MGDEYFEDIDRYVRNCLIAHQWTLCGPDGDFLRVYAQTNKVHAELVTFISFPSFRANRRFFFPSLGAQ
jgi:hypothetical protein